MYSISETWLTDRQVDSGSFIGLTLVSLKTFVMASEKFRAVDIDIHILESALGKTSIQKKRFLSGIARIPYPPP